MVCPRHALLSKWRGQPVKSLTIATEHTVQCDDEFSNQKTQRSEQRAKRGCEHATIRRPLGPSLIVPADSASASALATRLGKLASKQRTSMDTVSPLFPWTADGPRSIALFENPRKRALPSKCKLDFPPLARSHWRWDVYRQQADWLAFGSVKWNSTAPVQ